MTSSSDHTGPVAIIGMALRYAGAETPAEYWHNICHNVDCLHEATDEELLAAGIDPQRFGQPDFVRAAAFLPHTDKFDANFFGFSAHDAAVVDPQQRIFLECAWEAFEDAGYDPLTSGQGVGVFAGSGANSYRKQNLDPNMGTGAMLQTMVGNDKDFLATRVAYKLNLTGPAVVVQSACSTSLVATQMAFESLRRGECSMALAGGVSISFPQNTGYVFEPGMILSPDGRCRAFDARSAGTAIGRGAGAVLLKPLAAAVRDGDHIYAVVHGAAINNDGGSKAGYTAPSAEGQAAVIRRAMSIAGFAPATIRYVEAHGTGTEVGDSIEIAALARAFDGAALPPGSCTVSSVKPNIGHTDTAAGVSGLIKAALALHHRMVPGTLHFERPNPELGLEHTPFKVASTMTAYRDAEPFRAGVSAFGIGGTNAHVSLQEAPGSGALASNGNGHRPSANGTPHLFPFSAQSEGALSRMRERLAVSIESNTTDSLDAIAFTLQTGRRTFSHRGFVVARDREELTTALRGEVVKTQAAVTPDSRNPEIVFLFPGQGAQYVQMTRGLYETETEFRAIIDHGCDLLQPLLGLDLRTVLYPEAGQEEAAAGALGQTHITQPALLLIEYALAKLLMAAGVVPTMMIGHSLGEYAAATIAGVLQPDDMLRLIAERGRLVHTIPPGSMLAVALSEAALLERLPEGICIAAINAPRQTIVSGPTPLIEAFCQTLVKERIACQPLQTSHAFHSSMLDPIVGNTVDNVRRLKLAKPTIPFVSNLTGTWMTDDEAVDAAYWGAHLRHTVRFSEGLSLLTSRPNVVLIEVGPGETLLALARSATKGNKSIRLVATTRRPGSSVADDHQWKQALGQLWLAGVKLNWQTMHGAPRRVSLPTYPFERQRYWIDHSPKKAAANEATGPLKKRVDPHAWLYTRVWQSSLPTPAVISDQQLPPHWLVFQQSASDASPDPGSAVAQQLSLTTTVTVVVPGQSFERVPSGVDTRNATATYFVNADVASDYADLLSALRQSGDWPTHILFPASINEQEAPQKAFQRLFHLAQALAAATGGQPLSLYVLTDRAFDVLQAGDAKGRSTAVASLTEVAGLELSGVTARVIDCDFSDTPRLAALLLQEFATETDLPLVAYRGRTRWIPSWLQLPAIQQQHSSFRRGGTCIITGGTGGIGLVLAQYLARTAAAHLVLVSRSAFAPASEWERIANDPDAEASVRQKAHALRTIQALGGSVEVVAADTSDLTTMRAVVGAARQRTGTLEGIIHAAGITGASLLGSTTTETVDALFSAKGEGTAWIEEAIGPATGDTRSDAGNTAGPAFVLLCSSASAVVPSVGLSVYGAANAYLDGLAAAHDNPTGTRVIAANWDNWSETGMAAQAASQSPHLRSLPQFGITNQEAEVVFERLLSSPVSQVVVSTRPLAAWIQSVRAIYIQASPSPDQRTDEETIQHHPRPELSHDYVAPTNETEQAIVAIWQELLGIDRIGIQDDFFELGGHSLLGTQVIARVREQFQVEFPLRLIFEATTPQRFAAVLAKLPRLAAARTADEKVEAEREVIEI